MFPTENCISYWKLKLETLAYDAFSRVCKPRCSVKIPKNQFLAAKYQLTIVLKAAKAFPSDAREVFAPTFS